VPEALVTAQARSFPAREDSIGTIDEWVEAVCRAWTIDGRTLFAARLCVSELATNTIEHGVPAAANDTIEVTLSRRGDGVGITLADSRAPFDPTAAPPRTLPTSLEEAEIGGRGILLVRAYAPDLAYRHEGSRNHLSLTIHPVKDPATLP
jgi:anti-sigma regulatory factor (Ser/Thr protein kinase)